jgi:hypothetical protein
MCVFSFRRIVVGLTEPSEWLLSKWYMWHFIVLYECICFAWLYARIYFIISLRSDVQARNQRIKENNFILD